MLQASEIAGRVNQLKRQIDSQLYERTALSKDKAALLSKEKISAEIRE